MHNIEIITIISICLSFLLMIVLAFFLQKRKEKKQKEKNKKDINYNEYNTIEELKNISNVNDIEICLGKDIYLFNFYVLELINNTRKSLVNDLGVIIPQIKLTDCPNINPTEYTLKIQDQECGHGFIILTRYLAISNNIDNSLDGIRVFEPIHNYDAIWIDESLIGIAEKKGYTVIKDFEIISVHLLSLLKQNAYKFINRDYVFKLLNHLKKTYPILIDTIENTFSYGDIKNILIQLLKNKVSIKNLPLILELSLDNIDEDNIIEIIEQEMKGYDE